MGEWHRDSRPCRAPPGNVYRGRVAHQQARTGPGGIRRQTLSNPSGSAQLVEIDLLRAGTRFPTAQPLPAVPYFVFTCRAGKRHQVEVWPIALAEPLPVIPIPLLQGDEPVPLDLQQALPVTYDNIGYDQLVDYSQPPPGPLTPSELASVQEQLRRSARRWLTAQERTPFVPARVMSRKCSYSCA